MAASRILQAASRTLTAPGKSRPAASGGVHSMTIRIAPLAGAGLLFGLTALPVSACSGSITKSTIRHEGGAQSVVELVSSQTKFQPTDVKCPSGVDATVGGEFDCHFSGPEGVDYTAHMRIMKVEGERVDFDIKTRPS